MGELKRTADAQALTLRAELRMALRLDGLTLDEMAQRSGLELAALQAFLEGASINPRWQARLARWLEQSREPG
jgi:hypothetical protein